MSATTDLGRIMPLAKGAYDSGTAYEILDIVTEYGNTYIAKTTVPAGTSPSETASTAYWELIVIGHTWAASAVGIALVEAATVAAQRTLLDVDSKAEVTAKADAAQAAAALDATTKANDAQSAAATDATTKDNSHLAAFTHANIPTAAGKSAAENIGGKTGASEAIKLAAAVEEAAGTSAEVTAAPDHIWVLVGGALKRWTKAGFEAVVKALLPSSVS